MNSYDNKEIDLFTFFGGIQNLINSLKESIKNLFVYALKLFLFCFESFLKYWWIIFLNVAVFSGYGYYLNKTAKKVYVNTMFVETNYSSSTQLYRVVDNLNNLALIGDTATLSAELLNANINTSALKRFKVNHFSSLKETSELLKEYTLNLDKGLKESLTLDELKNKIKPTEYKKHLITVESTENSVFKPLQKSVINAVISSEYLSKKHENFVANYGKLKTNNEFTLKELEDLKILYEYEIRTQADKKRQVISSSAVMFTPEPDNIDREAPLKVINKIMSIQTINNAIEEELQEKNEIINIISGFDSVGKLKPINNIFNLFYGLLVGLGAAIFFNFIPFAKKWREIL